MEIIIYYIICICAVTAFALYIRNIVNKYKQSKGITEPYRPENVEIKNEFETVKVQAEIIDLYSHEETVGLVVPKTEKFYTVIFQTEDNERIEIEIPQEMYDGLEVGQRGELTLVEGDLYSFIC